MAGCMPCLIPACSPTQTSPAAPTGAAPLGEGTCDPGGRPSQCRSPDERGRVNLEEVGNPIGRGAATQPEVVQRAGDSAKRVNHHGRRSAPAEWPYQLYKTAVTCFTACMHMTGRPPPCANVVVHACGQCSPLVSPVRPCPRALGTHSQSTACTGHTTTAAGSLR